jgi:hypothetical protein
MNEYLQLQKELLELKNTSCTAASGLAISKAHSYIQQGNLAAAKRIAAALKQVNEYTVQHNVDLNIKREQIIASAAYRYR